MTNGTVVIERLEIIKRSLNRALADITEELDTRRHEYDYKDDYASNITDLVDKANRLEDAIHKVTHSFY